MPLSNNHGLNVFTGFVNYWGTILMNLYDHVHLLACPVKEHWWTGQLMERTASLGENIFQIRSWTNLLILSAHFRSKMFSKVQRQVCQKLTGLQQHARSVANITAKSQAVFDRESKYGAHNYHPLPVAINRGEGSIFPSTPTSPSIYTQNAHLLTNPCHMFKKLK